MLSLYFNTAANSCLLSRRLVKPLPFRHGDMRGVPFGGAMGRQCPTSPIIWSLLSFLLYCLYSTPYSESQRNSVSTFGQALGSEDIEQEKSAYAFQSKSVLWVKTLPCLINVPLSFFACLKNHETDECSIENLPQGLRKGRCLWRRGKTCPAQVVHALSRETGTPTREGGKPPALSGVG